MTINVIIPSKRITLTLIFWTTLLVGTLDISAAFLNSYLRSGTSPVIVLQFIASGVLGDSSFDGGFFTAFLGLIFHYFIAFSWTFIFFFVFPKLNISAKYKVISGLIYGIIIWLIMNLIIVPTSNTPSFHPALIQKLIGISFIMFLIGLPVSLIFHKYYSNTATVQKNQA
jgi:hypothetical protein